MIGTSTKFASSFRDPSGYLFWRNGQLYRRINSIYFCNYEHLMKSGLYNTLINERLLIGHEEVAALADDSGPSTIIKPKIVPFISYPYEWSFSQLKHAALATLTIQKKAMEYGMVLKDSSAYNIQFYQGQPILIDTLSFEKYNVGDVWVAYKQFCQHFLAPLALMSTRDIRLGQLLKIYIDGIPLDLTSMLLPWATRMNFGLLMHIHLHAKSQKYFSDKLIKVKRPKMNRIALLGLIDDLKSVITGLKWKPLGTEWAEYYENANYSSEAFSQKKFLLSQFLGEIKIRTVWDLGANTGIFSRLAADKGLSVVSFDIDPAAVERNYLDCLQEKQSHVLPLILDLTNPSSDIGWANEERMSLHHRGPVDAIFALALIHHLAISNNLPLEKLADFFSKLCRYLIIEFIPKNDSNVQKLLASRKDIFPEYTVEGFEMAFSEYFAIKSKIQIKNSCRTLYFMSSKGALYSGHDMDIN